jgi:hypothetical protein
MKNTNSFWIASIKLRQESNLNVVEFFSTFIKNMDFSKGSTDSTTFMDNIAHVMTFKHLNMFSSSQFRQLTAQIGKDNLCLFINFLVDNAIGYRKSGFTLNEQQLSVVRKFLAFKDAQLMLTKDKKKVINYLKGRKKLAKFD